MNRQRAVGILNNPLETESALKKLDESHFSLDRVFVIARNVDKENNIVDTQLCQSLRDRFNARIGNPANSSVTKDDEVSLSDALTHLDIPVDTARTYNDLVAAGKYLIMVEGDEDNIAGAEIILSGCGVREWVIYKIVMEHPEVIIVDRRTHH